MKSPLPDDYTTSNGRIINDKQIGKCVEGGEEQKPGMTRKNDVNHELAHNYRHYGRDSSQVPSENTL